MCVTLVQHRHGIMFWPSRTSFFPLIPFLERAQNGNQLNTQNDTTIIIRPISMQLVHTADVTVERIKNDCETMRECIWFFFFSALIPNDSMWKQAADKLDNSDWLALGPESRHSQFFLSLRGKKDESSRDIWSLWWETARLPYSPFLQCDSSRCMLICPHTSSFHISSTASFYITPWDIHTQSSPQDFPPPCSFCVTAQLLAGSGIP